MRAACPSRRRAAILGVLAAVLAKLSIAAGLYGPGFDPTPVDLPTIAHSTPTPVTTMDLLTLRDLHGSQLSPDGKWVAFVLGQAVYKSNSYRSGLFVVSTEPGSRPRTLGTAGPPHWDDIGQWWSEDPQWSKDSSHIYYRMKSGETWQVWEWNRGGGQPRQVTYLAHDVQNFQLSADGASMILDVTAPSNADRQQLSMQGILYDGSFQIGQPKEFVDQVLAARPLATETWLHALIDGSDRKVRDEEAYDYTPPWSEVRSGKLFSPQELAGGTITGPRISPDGRSVVYQRFVTDPAESEQTAAALYVRPTSGGRATRVTPVVTYVDQYWWSPDSKRIYYTEYHVADAADLHPSKVVAVKVSGGEPVKVYESSGFLYGYTNMSSTGRFLVCTFKSNSTAPSLILVDLESQTSRTIVDPNPELQNRILSPAKRMDITNKFGEHFWAHLLLPLGYETGRKYPLVMTGYRDGDDFYRGGTPGDEYPIQVLTSKGFAVLNMDDGPGHASGPDDFRTTLLNWASPLDAMQGFIAKLRQLEIIDGSRVGITGYSHGADMLAYGISHSDSFKAAIASGPGFDPIGYYVAPEEIRRASLRLYGLGIPDGKYLANWRELSASLNAKKIHAPILINGSDSELIGTTQFLVSLAEYKKPYEMFIYANELHDKNQPRHRYDIYERNVDWLRFWLQNYEDPEPAKADQYKRWRELQKLQDAESNNAPR